LRAQASPIDFNSIPEAWQRTPIIHLGPLANEMGSILPKGFSPALLGITPQGWMRQWDAEGRVSPSAWSNAEAALRQADAVVMSREDVGGDDELIEHMAHETRVLAVTEARQALSSTGTVTAVASVLRKWKRWMLQVRAIFLERHSLFVCSLHTIPGKPRVLPHYLHPIQ